jgi:hypothetical protein
MVEYDLPSHVIAAFFQFDHSPTVVTSLPACFFSCFEEEIRFFILWTILCTMPFPITQTADLRLAATALPVLLPILFMDIARLDPLTTPPGWTIYAILG